MAGAVLAFGLSLLPAVADSSPSVGSHSPPEGKAAVRGTVTDEASGNPVDLACASLVRVSDDTQTAEVETEPDGSYELFASPGEYQLSFRDCLYGDPEYLEEWYDDEPTRDTAQVLALAEGDVFTADAALTVRPMGTITGTVILEPDSDPLGGICVLAFPADESWNRFATTASDGTYVLTAPAGPAFVHFADCEGGKAHRPEYYDDAPTVQAASLVDVPANAMVDGIDAALAEWVHGTLVGRVTSEGTDYGLAQICVRAVGDHTLAKAGLTETEAGGHYSLSLPVGGFSGEEGYRIEFSDCHREPPLFRTEWFDDALDFADATTVDIAADGEAVADAALGLANPPPPPPPSPAEIHGVVTDALTGLPVHGACIDAYDADTAELLSSAPSGDDGSYTLTIAGSATVKLFTACGQATGHYFAEWYDDVPHFGVAQSIAVSPGTNLVGIDVALAPIPPEPSPADVAVQSVIVSDMELAASGASMGLRRTVTVVLENVGETASTGGLLRLSVCPATAGGCRLLATHAVAWLDGGASRSVISYWDQLTDGIVGDVVVRAVLEPDGWDANATNNLAESRSSALVGGTGFGVGLLPG